MLCESEQLEKLRAEAIAGEEREFEAAVLASVAECGTPSQVLVAEQEEADELDRVLARSASEAITVSYTHLTLPTRS